MNIAFLPDWNKIGKIEAKSASIFFSKFINYNLGINRFFKFLCTCVLLCTLLYTYVLLCTLDIHVCTMILSYNWFHNALEYCNIADIRETRGRKFSKSFRIAARKSAWSKKICQIDAKPIPKFVSDKTEQLWFFLFSGRGGWGGGGEDTPLLVI